MSDIINAEIDRRAAGNALDAGPTAEPVLAHLDEWRKGIIMQMLYEWRTVKNENGISERVPIKCRYPDLENVTADVTSHINRILNLPWSQTQAMYLNWWSRYKSLKRKHRGHPDALTILRTLDQIYTADLYGGSLDGSHQRYIWHLGGGAREINLKQDGGRRV